MTTDRLGELIEAFREETAHRDRDVRVLRGRVLRSVEAQRKVVRPPAWLVPLLAVLVGTGALAATSSRAASRLAAWLHPVVAAPSEPTRDRKADRGRVAPTTQRAVVAPVLQPSPSREIVAIEDLPADGPIPAPHRASVSGVAPGAEAVSPPRGCAPSEELALYRTAHDLHFGGGEPARALAAFREYLARYPDGALATEARFNEAVCLARLGRKSEARTQLEPFASGAYGAHLRAKAEELLAAPLRDTRP